MKFQKKIEEFCKEYGIQNKVELAVLDLASEVGEIAKEVLKGSEYGKTPLKLGKNFEMEMGDTFFSLIVLANETGVNLNVALESALEKYKKRFAKKGNLGSD